MSDFHTFCLIDYETASQCDLKKAGAWRYAEDITTEILCLGYTLGKPKDEVVLTADDCYQKTGAAKELMRLVLDPGVLFVAHNCAFEKAIWRHIMVAQYDWPDIPDERWHDTMAVCAMKGLPLQLERAALVLRLSSQKDMEGSRITKALSKLDKKGYSVITDDKLNRVLEYNIGDLHSQTALHRRVKGLGAEERKVWLLDQKINERGVRLDMEYVDAAQAIVDEAGRPLLAEFRELTGVNPTQGAKFQAWLAGQGCTIPNLQKETVAKFLKGDIDGTLEEDWAGDEEDYQEEDEQIELPFLPRRALEIRQIIGSASIKKLVSMRACVGSDGNARGLLQYHGAGPGRWAGRLLQPQNFPRPSLKVDGEAHDPGSLVSAILTRDSEFVRLLFGEPIEAVVSGLRHTIVSRPGNELVVGDFATIEARIVLALAGQYDKTDLIATGKDIYIDMAQTIYKRPIDKKKDPAERQTGKNSVLGLGFQMGWKKFRMRYAQKETPEFCKEVVRIYREEFAPNVPKLWKALERAAIDTVWSGHPHEAYGVRYQLEDGWLTARLPSGRKLWYFNPQKCRRPMPWDKDDIRQGFTYQTWKQGKWVTVDAYGGLLTENVVQALARDLLVAGMFAAEEAGFPIVLTVHDEVIADVMAGRADPKLLDEVMCYGTPWARSLRIPIATDCWAGTRYRK